MDLLPINNTICASGIGLTSLTLRKLFPSILHPPNRQRPHITQCSIMSFCIPGFRCLEHISHCFICCSNDPSDGIKSLGGGEEGRGERKKRKRKRKRDLLNEAFLKHTGSCSIGCSCPNFDTLEACHIELFDFYKYYILVLIYFVGKLSEREKKIMKKKTKKRKRKRKKTFPSGRIPLMGPN